MRYGRNGGRKTRKEGDIIQFKSLLVLKTIKKGTDGRNCNDKIESGSHRTE